jgi:CubicO group peptidase (beta-lactamase class C family)
MSSGLDPVDNGRCAAVGSCLSYFGGASSVAGALARGLVSQPGTRWDYENYDTILAVHALKTALGAQDYLAFPRAALLDRIGMRNTLVGVDRFGDFVLSSQVYTNARSPPTTARTSPRTPTPPPATAASTRSWSRPTTLSSCAEASTGCRASTPSPAGT